MKDSNKIWLVVIVSGWLLLVGSAIATNNFQHYPNWWQAGEKQ